VARRRSLVAQYTRLRPLDDIPAIRLHLADDPEPVWHATAETLGVREAPIPFWAFAWAGGIALARYVLEHPDEVVGRRVLDLATGSGLCAIAAVRAGSSNATAADIDPFAAIAVALNARTNGVRVDFIGRDLLDEEPPAADVILAGDTWYEAPFAERVARWLGLAAERGTRVLLGDPGRRYRPATGLVQLAEYEVHTARVYTIDHPGQESRRRPIGCPLTVRARSLPPGRSRSSGPAAD
jgi:predicted nicotinamide N-methyase